MRKYRHKNILPLFCSFVHGSNLWLVMPWVSGGTLCEIIRARCARLTGLQSADVISLGLHSMSAICLLTANLANQTWCGKCRFQEGMEEDLIATIAKEILEGLEYMHEDGSMHRCATSIMC